MRQETVNIYTFDELSDRAKQRALDHCRYWQVEHEWWDGVYMDAERIGLKITAFDLDRHLHADGDFISSAESCAKAILEEHGASCETFKDASAYLEDLTKLAEDDDAHEDLDREFLKTILEDYAWNLQHEYEWLTDDAQVEEFILANDYEFDEDGDLA